MNRFSLTSLKHLTLLLMLTVAISSCSVEKKLARQFVNKADNYAVMLLFPDQVYLVNKKTDTEKPAFFFADAQTDTSLLSNTIVFPELQNDALINTFRSSMTKELLNYGIRAFEEKDMEVFLKQDSNFFMLNIAQIELQEFTTLVEDAINVGEVLYTKDIWLNGLNMAVWIELNAANAGNLQPTVLFAENDLYDRYDGFFTQRFLTGEIDYRLTIDTITPQDAMNFVQYLGRLYAAYTFDFIMNRNLEMKIPPAERSGKYYRYDPYRQLLFSTETDRFILMDE